MDPRIRDCPGLTEQDVEQLAAVEQGLWITADVSRADLLLCCLFSAGRALVVQHAMPKSIPSTYREEAVGRIFTAEERPFLLHVLLKGRGGRRQIEILSSGAPVIQDVYPIYNAARQVIAALVVETNMIAHERQRRRTRSFRQAVVSLLEMCLRGELASAANLSRFGQYDGIYLADHNHQIIYMSGIAANMFRSIGLAVDMQGQRVADLEAGDEQLVDHVMQTGRCAEDRDEAQDGRVWVRKGIPLHMTAVPVQFLRFNVPWLSVFATRDTRPINAALVLIHNATDAVAKERELNVKSAIIQEVHHRVKNNLQTIAAILRIQARRAKHEESRQLLGDAVNRILSMSVIHEFLSHDEHRPINIRDVCQRIAQQVQQVAADPEQRIDIRVTGPNIRLPAGQATPTAMVVNELMLNALEHGLSGHKEGQILIELEDLGDAVQLAICNSGSALPPNFDPQQSQSLGLQIVHTLVSDDLKGNLKIESMPAEVATVAEGRPPEEEGVSNHVVDDSREAHETGTRAVITFPKRVVKVD